MVSRPRFDTRQARSSASAISIIGHRSTSLRVATRDTLAHVRVGSTCLLGALPVRAWCGDRVPMDRVSDDGLKLAAAFVT